MATHSSILAWEIPRTEEPGGLELWGVAQAGSQKSLTQLSDLIINNNSPVKNVHEGLAVRGEGAEGREKGRDLGSHIYDRFILFFRSKKSSNLFFQKMQYWLIKVMVSGLTALAGMHHVEKRTGNSFCTRVGAGI